MKKLYSTIMMLAMMVAALNFTACGGDDDGGNDGGGGNSGRSSATSLTIVKSDGVKYVSMEGIEGRTESDINGNLTDNGYIFCFMRKENTLAQVYFHIKLVNGEKTVNDFPVGYDLSKPSVYLGLVLSSEYKYKYVSGSLNVVSNNGKGFTLKFDDYKAERASGSIVINGTLYVEKERLF